MVAWLREVRRCDGDAMMVNVFHAVDIASLDVSKAREWCNGHSLGSARGMEGLVGLMAY